MRRTFPLVALFLLAAVGCTSGSDIEVELAPVRAGEVVQTVAAGALLEPAERVTVSAPAGGEVAELLVADGDQVEAGQPLVRLASDSIDQQVSQAEAAVEAAESLAGAADGAGFDLSPVVGAFGAQLEAVFPPLIGSLNDQIDALEAAAAAAQERGEQFQSAIEQATPEGPGKDIDALPVPESPPVDEGGNGEVGGNEEVGGNGEVGGNEELTQAIADARQRLAEAEAGYRDARRQLAEAESDARSQAEQATRAQLAAADAQRQQAEMALDAARARVEDLVIVAPVPGVVELARGDGGAVAPPDAPTELGELGDLGGLLGGSDATSSTGPLAEGVEVGVGQPLLTIFDLSGFTARVDIDEIDIVEVEVGQAVTVLVDAFPGAELAGTVRHIALSPQRPAGGGAIFPVTVSLDAVPDDVQLRVGLTASAEIEVLRVEGDTVVPTSALLRRGGSEVVHVVRDGVVSEVPITVQAIGDDTAAVTGDLDVGEQVVTTGVESVEDGDEVGG